MEAFQYIHVTESRPNMPEFVDPHELKPGLVIVHRQLLSTPGPEPESLTPKWRRRGPVAIGLAEPATERRHTTGTARTISRIASDCR
jgi:hypothetical protein